MPEIRTVTTLVAKRDEIEAAITNYERRLEQARADLSHVNACIAIFEACDEPGGTRAYVDRHRMFARGEMMRLCKEALASGPKTTKELALIRYRRQGAGASDGDANDPCVAAAMAPWQSRWRRKDQGRAGLGHAELNLPDIETDSTLNIYVRYRTLF